MSQTPPTPGRQHLKLVTTDVVTAKSGRAGRLMNVGADADVLLAAGERTPVVGDRVRVLGDHRVGTVAAERGGQLTLHLPNGDGYTVPAESTELIEETAEQLQATELTRQELARLYTATQVITRDQAVNIGWTYSQINYGAWSELKHSGNLALLEAGLRGTTDQWLDEEAAIMGELRRHVQRTGDDTDIRAASIAESTAGAVAVRHLIDVIPGWTQKHYDHATRAWRENIGPVHQDDELTPASWSDRPVPSAATKRQFDADMAAMDRVIVDRGALRIDEHSEYGDTYLDEERLGPELTAQLVRLRDYGVDNGLFADIS